MKKSVKSILGVIVIGVIVLGGMKIYNQSKELEQLQIDKSAWKYKYEKLNDEFEAYKDEAGEIVFKQFLESLGN